MSPFENVCTLHNTLVRLTFENFPCDTSKLQFRKPRAWQFEFPQWNFFSHDFNHQEMVVQLSCTSRDNGIICDTNWFNWIKCQTLTEFPPIKQLNAGHLRNHFSFGNFKPSIHFSFRCLRRLDSLLTERKTMARSEIIQKNHLGDEIKFSSTVLVE